MFTSLRRLACIAALGLVGLGLSSSAQAGGYDYGYGGYAPQCYYKEVITYKIISEPYTKYITVYDSYGCAQVVAKTFYHDIQIPVKSYVKVCY